MIDLYGMASPNVVKVLIMLEEAGLPYRVKYVDVFRQEQFEPEFQRLSPTGKVPVILDSEGPDGEPISVFESGAILLYLAEKTGRLLPTDPRARAGVFQWLMVQVSLMGPMGGQAVHFNLFAPPGNEYAQERYFSQCANVQKLLDKRLGEAPYLGGEDLSLADVATFPWVYQAVEFFPWLQDDDGAKLRDGYPNLARWYETLWKRPAFDRAMSVRAELHNRGRRAGIETDGLDRFYLRGAYSLTPPEARGVVARYKS
ncbi:MAG: glutathione S-transferase N-terminal domain-containing protein [Caulobacteraceae bacterium]|nr:glutathione S-transferase N-terminal domain-containing protein [Caulobacteraceae bacterium]